MARTAAKSRSRRSRASSARGDKERSEDGPILIAAGSEIVGLILIGLSLVATLALATYAPEDPVAELIEVSNGAGPVGATLASLLLKSLGAGAVVLVAACAFLGGRLVMSLGLPGLFSRFWIGAVALVPAVAVLPSLLFNLAPETIPWVEPGWLGAEGSRALTLLFGSAGALVLTSMFLLVGVLSLTGISTGTTLGVIGRGLSWAGAQAVWIGEWLLGQARVLGQNLLEWTSAGAKQAVKGLVQLRDSVVSISVWRERRARRTRVQERREPEFSFEDDAREAEEEDAPEEIAAEEPEEPSPVQIPRKLRAKEGPDIVDHDEEREKTRKPEQETFRFHDGGATGPFQLPENTLFSLPPETTRSYDRDSLLMNSKILEKKLADFSVTGRVVRVHPGPVVTMYEYEPAAGIKVNKIVGLTDDLAMALRAISIRIIAPLPGKSGRRDRSPESADRETVFLREMPRSGLLPEERRARSRSRWARTFSAIP